jgi:chromosomal replication initiation ATPase DnaA
VISDSQLTLDFEHRIALSGEDFLVADCNREAISWIDLWPNWPTPALVIFGPVGSGKSHLAAVFEAFSGAKKITVNEFDWAACNIVSDLIIEDIDSILNSDQEEAFLHLYNATKEASHKVLITATAPPARW